MRQRVSHYSSSDVHLVESESKNKFGKRRFEGTFISRKDESTARDSQEI